MPAPDDELEQQVTEMLACLYQATPWGKMRTRHRTYDVWVHRVQAATGGGALTVQAYLERLRRWLGLQDVPQEAVRIALALEGRAAEVLRLIGDEAAPLAVRARLMAQARRKSKEEPSHDDSHQGSLFD